MNILLFAFFLSLGHQAPPPHDVAIAMFRISQSEEELKLDITLDIQDFANDIGKNQEDIILEDIQSYIDQHTLFKFNGIKNDVRLLDVKKVRDHFLILGSFQQKVKSIKDIHIRNTCLVKVPDHSNIVQVQLNEQLRDFRMHEGREDIDIRY